MSAEQEKPKGKIKEWVNRAKKMVGITPLPEREVKVLTAFDKVSEKLEELGVVWSEEDEFGVIRKKCDMNILIDLTESFASSKYRKNLINNGATLIRSTFFYLLNDEHTLREAYQEYLSYVNVRKYERAMDTYEKALPAFLGYLDDPLTQLSCLYKVWATGILEGRIELIKKSLASEDLNSTGIVDQQNLRKNSIS